MKAHDNVASVSIKLLRESTTNPRRMFDPAAQKDLVDSIRQHGVLQPILVRKLKDGDGSFEVVAGARRFRAAKKAGLLEMPVLVRELTDKEVLEVQYVENLQRSDIHPVDEGIGYRKLIDDHGYDAEALGKKLGKSRGYVYGRMQLAKLGTKAMTLFVEGQFDLSIAQLLTRIADPGLQDLAARDIVKGFRGEPMTFRDAKDHVQRNYQNDLREAPFPTGDATLVPAAGKCGDCPHRTGNQRTLFGDAAEKERADVCTLPSCYKSKVAAFFERRKVEVEAAGGTVLTGKKAETARYDHELVDLDVVCYEDPKQRTYRKLLGDRTGVSRVLVEGRNGEPIEKAKRADVVSALKAAGAIKRDQKTPATSEEERRRAREHKARLAGFAEVLPKLRTAAAALDAKTAWALVIRWGLSCQTERLVMRERKLGHHDLLEQSAADLQAIAMEILARGARMGSPSSPWNGWSAETSAVAKACKINLAAAAKAAAKAKQKAKPKAKPKKQPKKPAKAKGAK